MHEGLVTLAEVAMRAAAPGADERTAGAVTGGPALSRGELQLVTYLPTRMTNADIASELGVSVNTVKTRLRRLFAKLGVHDRRHAVERGVELGLIPAGRAGPQPPVG